MSATSVTVAAATRPGRASASNTVRTTSRRRAPMARAASTFPGATSRSAASTSRARNGTAAMVSGTIVAVEPMVVPVTRRVTGATRTSSTMNGTERPTLTTAPSTWCSTRLGSRPSGAATYSSTPSGMPSSSDRPIETPTMYAVSQVASTSAGAMRSQLVISGHLPHDVQLRSGAGGQPGQGLPHLLRLPVDADLEPAEPDPAEVLHRAADHGHVDGEAADELGEDRVAAVAADGDLDDGVGG